jgi:hypothetical protein
MQRVPIPLLFIVLFFTANCARISPVSQGPEATAIGSESYDWTTDHLHVGVRWQPHGGLPGNNAYDAARPVIAEDSSYAQFWVSWAGVEPTEAHGNYLENRSDYLAAIETAVDACVAEGLKVELVLWHCPAWASVSGNAGAWEARTGEYAKFTARIARHFKGRVHAYQLYHEANLKSMLQDGDIDYLIEEVFKKGARAVRRVYAAAPAEAVIISTSGCSPCDACEVVGGMKGTGAQAVHEFYDRLIADSKLMAGVDALNLNVSDHVDGYGNMEGSLIASAWANYDLVREKLDAAGYPDKKVLAAESWVVWDGAPSAADVNGDGEKNEVDAYLKTLTLMGQCLQRGLNTMNLPWSDNSSGWAMGLTKRRDYNGRVKLLKPEVVIPANDGGADIVTEKMGLSGNDDNFVIRPGGKENFTVEDYINPSDPNHLHYYIWRWYAQLAGGSDEVIRHALAGEFGNDITVWGPGYTGAERYRIASYNRTKDRFTVLLYSGGGAGLYWAKVSIPATIQNGKRYNNVDSRQDFRGEGFAEGEPYYAVITTKDISMQDGSDQSVERVVAKAAVVENDSLTVVVDKMNRFTRIEFFRGIPPEGVETHSKD